MSNLRSESVPVFIAHEAENGLSVATFDWPGSIVEEIEPYSIALNEFVSIEFDKHTPVRLNTVSVYDEGAKQSAEMLGNYIGLELTDAILQAKRIGFSAITVSLSSENRFAIAELQQQSPSTPPIIRRSCEVMLDAHKKALDQENAGSHATLIPRTRGTEIRVNRPKDQKLS